MTKKSFINHPAMQFISTPQKEGVAEGTEKPTTTQQAAPSTPPPAATQTGTLAPQRAETKSRRVQILIQPGLHDRAKADARAHGTSFNEYLHRALQHYLTQHKE